LFRSSSKVACIPPTVPWPPSKAISIKAPTNGGIPKNGVKTKIESSNPTTYCPQPSDQPKASCGPPTSQTFFILGKTLPKNKVAKTTLIIITASGSQTSIMSEGIIPSDQKESFPTTGSNNRPKTCGPKSSAKNPPITEEGKKSFCIHFTRMRIHFPIKRKTPKYNKPKPI